MDSADDNAMEVRILKLLEISKSEDRATQLAACHQICGICSSDDTGLIKNFISRGCIPIIVASLSSDEETLKYEALKALKKVVSISSKHIESLVNANSLERLLALLYSENVEIVKETISILGILTGKAPPMSGRCLELYDFLTPLLGFISSAAAFEFLGGVTEVISNLCKVKIIRLESIREIVSTLAPLINHDNPQILLNTLSAFHNLTEHCDDYDRNRGLVDTGIIPNLVQFLDHSDVNIQLASLKVLGNIVAGLDEHAQLVLDNGILHRMPVMLTHPRKNIARGAMWLLSNITAANEGQIQEVLSSGLMPIVINLLNKENNLSLRDSVWTVVNIMQHGTPQQVKELVRLGVIPQVCSLLDYDKNESVALILEGISDILQKIGSEHPEVYLEVEKCGGLARIDALTKSGNVKISLKAQAIMEAFSSVEMKSVTNSFEHVELDNNGT